MMQVSIIYFTHRIFLRSPDAKAGEPQIVSIHNVEFFSPKTLKIIDQN
jgi:hypothetical protein